MFCHNCGKQIPDGTKFCHYCGAAQDVIQSQGASVSAAPQPDKVSFIQPQETYQSIPQPTPQVTYQSAPQPIPQAAYQSTHQSVQPAQQTVPQNIAGNQNKRLALLFIPVCLLVVLIGCGAVYLISNRAARSQKGNGNISPTVSEDMPDVPSGALGDYYVSILSADLTVNNFDEPIIVVTIEFTNNSDTSTTFNDAVSFMAYQSENFEELLSEYLSHGGEVDSEIGKMLEQNIKYNPTGNGRVSLVVRGDVAVSDDYDEDHVRSIQNNYYMLEIMPGGSERIEIPFILKDTVKDVEVELQPRSETHREGDPPMLKKTFSF